MTSLLRSAMAGVLVAGAIGCLAMSAPVKAEVFASAMAYRGGTSQSVATDGPAALAPSASTIGKATDQAILALIGASDAPGLAPQLLHYAAEILDIPVPMNRAVSETQVDWSGSARYGTVSRSGAYLRDTVNGTLTLK